MNIVEPILARCRDHPDAPALCLTGSPDRIVSYGRLGAMINNFARRSIGLGLAPGQVVALVIDDPVAHAALILALARLGVVSISAKGSRLPSGLDIDAALYDGAQPPAAPFRAHQVDFTWAMGDGKPPADPGGYEVEADDLCRIILTSGTTGEAKAVGLSHRMVAERISRHNDVFGSEFPDYSRIFVDLGFATSLGYMFLIYTLSRGGVLLRRGDSFANAVRTLESRQVQVWVGSPGGMPPFIEVDEKDSAQSRPLQMLLSAGSLLSRALFARVRASMCPNILCVYGSTETSMVATAPAQAIADIPGAAGFLTPGVTVQAVDAADNPLPRGSEGVIRIRGSFNADAYLSDPEESRRAFRSGWFYPGDVGFITAENLLVISGRERQVLNIGGNKVTPEAIESVLTAFDGIDQAGAVAVLNPQGIEEIWAVLVSSPELDARKLHGHCRKQLPSHFVPRRFMRAAVLPRNEMGKLDRAMLQEMAKQASLHMPARAEGEKAL